MRGSAANGTLSIHSIDTTRRETFYWLAVLATFAMGTATGDLAAYTLNLGFLSAGLIFAAAFLVPAIAWRFFDANPILSFWTAYVLTRPLGASFADWTGKSRHAGGLGYGDGPVAFALLLAIAGLVGYVAWSESAVRSEAGARDRLGRGHNAPVLSGFEIGNPGSTVGRFPVPIEEGLVVDGLRRGARVVLVWFSALYVLAIIVAIFLAGEGIFRLKNVVNSDDCSKKGVHVAATDCVGNSNTLDAHRALGTFLVLFSILFLIVALLALAARRNGPHRVDRRAHTHVPADRPGRHRRLGRWSASA